MAIYHIERLVEVSESYIEVWEVEAPDEDTAIDTVDALGTRLSTESDGAEPNMNYWVNEVYKVPD